MAAGWLTTGPGVTQSLNPPRLDPQRARVIAVSADMYGTVIQPCIRRALGQAGLPPQRSAACAACSSLIAESDPAKSTLPATNCSRPAPEPVGL